MPDAPLVDSIGRLLNQPLFVAFAILVVALTAIWAITKVGGGSIRILEKAGREHADALGEIALALRRVVERLDYHDEAEQRRHEETRRSLGDLRRP